jgi:hypothetical protein
MTAKLSPLLLLAASALLLAGCTSPAPTDSSNNDSDSTDSSDESSGGVDALGTPCEDNTSGIELFSDPAISEYPEYGQVWGDGSALVIGYDDYVPGTTLGYDISYVQDDGAVIPVTGGFFMDDPVGTTFTSTDPLFNSASDGYYGIVDIAVTDDAGTTYLGAYCMVLAISE